METAVAGVLIAGGFEQGRQGEQGSGTLANLIAVAEVNGVGPEQPAIAPRMLESVFVVINRRAAAQPVGRMVRVVGEAVQVPQDEAAQRR